MGHPGSKRLEHIVGKSQKFQRRTPRWCWMVVIATLALLLPGAGLTQEKPVPREQQPSVVFRENYVILVPQTRLHRLLASNAIYALINGYAVMQLDTANLDTLNKDFLRHALAPYAGKTKSDVNFHKWVDTNTADFSDATGKNMQRELRERASGRGLQTVYRDMSTGNAWREMIDMVTSEKFPPDTNPEEPVGDGAIQVYPVRTTFSQYLTRGMACVVDVLGQFGKDEQPVLEPEVHESKLNCDRGKNQQPPSHDSPRDAILARIKQLGGTVEFDDKNPNRPVVEVVLAGTEATDSTLAQLEAFPDLKRLVLDETKISDAGLVHLREFATLEQLYLSDTQVTNSGVRHLKGLTTLRELGLTSTKVDDNGLTHLKDLNLLEKLGIDLNPQITGDGLRHLHRMTNLKQLFVGGTPISDVGLMHLSGMKELEFLILWRSDQTGSGLIHLKGLTKLRHLDLGSNRDLSDSALESLKALVALERLDIPNTPVTGSFLQHLKDLPNLRSLVLRGSKIADPSLRHLRDLSKLQSLMIDGTEVTDTGIAHLNGLTELRQLDVGGNSGVTDKSVEHLKTLSNLKYLQVGGSEISVFGIDELRRSFPNVKGL